VNITLNNVQIPVEEGMTILDVAKTNGVHIPTLCHLDLASIKMVNKVGTCRICMVEVEGRASLMPACVTKVWDGMKIFTNTRKAVKARRTVVELFLSNHPKDCLVCQQALRIAGFGG
jgi:NADH dehydrogenase/NADH:ubiquinone oxidoreductase subunit G